jgi:hypothetical protein
MAEWSKNSRACTTLWSTLYILKQLTTSFVESGNLTVANLAFYNPLSSAQQRRQEATILADQLDNIFRKVRGAKYEAKITRTDAISSLVEILTNKEKTVKDLATSVDAAYAFWGEA